MRIEVAYERSHTPHRYERASGTSDRAAVYRMRAAGVKVGHLGLSLVTSVLAAHSQGG